MTNPLKTITRSLVIFCLLLGAAIAYNSCSKKPEIKAEIQASSSSTKKKKTKRTIPQDGSPIIEETEEDEKLDQFVKASLSAPAKRPRILGLTLSYDEGIKYNLIFGKAVLDHLYVVGKVQTDFNLSKAEAGILYVF